MIFLFVLGFGAYFSLTKKALEIGVCLDVFSRGLENLFHSVSAGFENQVVVGLLFLHFCLKHLKTLFPVCFCCWWFNNSSFSGDVHPAGHGF